MTVCEVLIAQVIVWPEKGMYCMLKRCHRTRQICLDKVRRSLMLTYCRTVDRAEQVSVSW